MPFHLHSPWGATLMPLRACAMDSRRNEIPRVSKNSSPTLSRLWTKVREIFGQRRVGDSLYLSTSLPDCACHVSFRRYSPLSLKVVNKPNKCKRFWAPIFGRDTRTFLRQIVSVIITIHRLAKFGWAPFADLSSRSLAMSEWVCMV